MNHLDILLPYGIPPAELARDLARALGDEAPSLAMLTSRARDRTEETRDVFARALPHEAWLAEQLGLGPGLAPGASPPLAAGVAGAFGRAPAAGQSFLLSPVHLHIARDHLVLADRRQLELDDSASRALFEGVRGMFEESGFDLFYAAAGAWLLRADGWQELSTATPDAAGGHNVDIWMPAGVNDRPWRKLQNEAQMLLYAHPVNEERAQRGLKPVNSLWLWGGADAASGQAVSAGAPAGAAHGEKHGGNRPGAARHPGIDGLPGWTDAPLDMALARPPSSTMTGLLASNAPAGLLVEPALFAPALAADWGAWLDSLRGLEKTLFAPALAALRAGRLKSLALATTDGERIVEYAVDKAGLGKFWRKASLGNWFQ